MAAANKTVWGIHTMDDPLFLNQNLIAIGWEEMGDLSAISTSRDAYKEKYIAAYPDAKKGSIATSAGMLYRFVHEVQEGDYVVFPSKIDRKINIGVVESAYFYEATAALYPNRRKVKWLKHLQSRQQIDEAVSWYEKAAAQGRSEEHTSELQSRTDP